MDVQQKYILIGNMSFPYSCSDDRWTAAEIETVYALNYKDWQAEKLRQEGKPQAEIDDVFAKPVPSLKWYPLNKFGYYNYSISRDGLVLNHSTGLRTRGYFDPLRGYRLSLQNSVTRATDKPYLHRLLAEMFIGPAPTPNSIVVHQIEPNKTATHADKLHWADKNSTKSGMTYQRKGLGKPVTMFRRPDGYPKHFPFITWFSIKEAVEFLIEEAENYGLDDLAAGVRSGGKSNIRRACDAASDEASAYGFLWKWAGQGKCFADRKKGELWKPLMLPDTEFFEVSTRGRVRTSDSKQNYKVLRVGSGCIGPHGYKVCNLRKTREKGSVTKRINELMIMAFYGKEVAQQLLSGKIYIHHINFNILDSDIYNLALCPSIQNLLELRVMSPQKYKETFQDVFPNVQQMMVEYINHCLAYPENTLGKVHRAELTELQANLVRDGSTFTYNFPYLNRSDYKYHSRLDKFRDYPDPPIPREFREKMYDTSGQKIKQMNKRNINRGKVLVDQKQRDYQPRTVQEQYKLNMAKYNKKAARRAVRRDAQEERELAEQMEEEANTIEEITDFVSALQQSGKSYEEFIH